MKIPSNMTENEVISIINNIANRLARRFKFGYHDIEDMKQQARLFALEAMPNYDGIRPLENFLWTHVRNRLCNLKRDKYERLDVPCIECENYINKICGQHDNKTNCCYYQNWIIRNNNKRNLMNPIDLCGVNDINEKNIKDIDILDYKAIITIIDKELPISLRPLFLKLKFGNKLTKVQKNKIQVVIQDILRKHGYVYSA